MQKFPYYLDDYWIYYEFYKMQMANEIKIEKGKWINELMDLIFI